MKIKFSATDPTVAAVMANGIAEAFIEHNLEIRVKPYRDAAEWLQSRLVESKAKVGDSENQLQRYKEGKGVVSFETKENILNQKLQELTTQLVQTESKRQEAEIKYRQILSVIDKPDQLTTVPDIMNNLVVQGLRNEELALRRQVSELAEKYGEKHPQLIKTNSQLEVVKRNINLEARKMLRAAKSDYDVALSRETSLRRGFEAQKQEVLGLTRKAIDFNVIAGESGSNKQFYDLLLKKLQEASLSGGMSVSNIQIVDNAIIPDGPIKPQRAKNLLLALLLGLFGGISVAFFVEYMDDTIKTAEDVEKATGLPLLDIVPMTPAIDGPIFMLKSPESMTCESFRTIRTGIMLSSVDEVPLKVLLVTSATPNEGKSTVAANLAVAMSQMGERVLLIDVDMRRHNLHDLFVINNNIGISDLIIDPTKLASAVQEINDIPKLYIITGGTLAPNPSELLSSDRMRILISGLRDKFDRIILDSPPLMAFSDSLVLSRLADGVVMVAWGAKTPRATIIKAVDSLKGVGARILGVVLNKIDSSRSPGYGYYSYYYSDSKGAKKKKK
jgi:capsular exopolysaccharide synthesis family protein